MAKEGINWNTVLIVGGVAIGGYLIYRFLTDKNEYGGSAGGNLFDAGQNLFKGAESIFESGSTIIKGASQIIEIPTTVIKDAATVVGTAGNIADLSVKSGIVGLEPVQTLTRGKELTEIPNTPFAFRSGFSPLGFGMGGVSIAPSQRMIQNEINIVKYVWENDVNAVKSFLGIGGKNKISSYQATAAAPNQTVTTPTKTTKTVVTPTVTKAVSSGGSSSNKVIVAKKAVAALGNPFKPINLNFPFR